MNRHFINKTFWGLLLIAAGVLFLLNQQGIIQVDPVDLAVDYWPVFLIWAGLHGIVANARSGHSWGGIWNALLILLGTYFLLNNLDVDFVHNMDLWQFAVPGLLIILGFSMLAKGPSSRYEDRKTALKQERREERDRRRQERDEEREHRRQERDERRQERHHHHSGNVEEEPVPPFDPEYSRKIEQDLDQVFHERVVKKLGEDPFPLASEAGIGASAPKNGQEPPSMKGQEESWKSSWKEGWKQEWKDNWKDTWQDHKSRRPVERSNFIGDIYLGRDYWHLEPMNISHFIGDTMIDLTKASIPMGETKLSVSAFIGDVKVFVPNDIQLEISVTASAFIGDMQVLERYEGGMFRNMKYDTRNYAEADKKIHLTVSMFIGDIIVKRVG